MYEALKNFNQQFLYEPEIINGEALVKKSSTVVVGMGGSALAADLLQSLKPELDIIVRRDYGLPNLLGEVLANKLIILSSYSGNTIETIDAFHEALEKNLSVAVIATGGKLLALAQEHKTPYIELPNTGVQPRLALGFSLRALLKLLGEKEELQKTNELSATLIPANFEEEGKALAGRVKGYMPLIYTSTGNAAVAYNWKIKFNENAKIPAFYNVFPELNHNEINGFDAGDYGGKFYFLILKDEDDSLAIKKRMNVTEKIYRARGLKGETLGMAGDNPWQKIFSSLILADWASYYLAKLYNIEPEQVPTVEEFKKLIAE